MAACIIWPIFTDSGISVPINIKNGDFKDLNKLPDLQDAVVAFEVIEHLQDLNALFVIFQNKIKVGAEEDQFGPFPSPLKNLNLYQIQDALSAPINFGFGEAINMLMTEFIIYPDETENVDDVTEITSDNT